jgi:hypothetical protein
MATLPDHLQINAYASDADNSSALDPAAEGRLLARSLALRDALAGPVPIDSKDWTDARIGWGVVLPDDVTMTDADKAAAADAPTFVRELIEKRKGVVLRYTPGAPLGTLRRHYGDGSVAQDIQVAAQAWGTSRGKVPRYLLMLGSPEKLPWTLQFLLQADCFVGRLDLAPDALERYVGRLLVDWSDSDAAADRPLVWATSQAGDITRLMRDSIAAPLYGMFKTDGGLAPTFIDGSTSAATGQALINALTATAPAFVATTSHGMTGPVANPAKMKADLGILVDSAFRMVDPGAMLAAWQPDGAIWYAHACCSAGSRSTTSFAGLVVPGSGVDRILAAVAGCGDTIAPFPLALLSAEKPAKAFVGHVEPTFDWSVRHNSTGQFLTNPLLDTFYQRLFSGEPIGMALDSCRRMASGLLNASYGTSIIEVGEGQSRSGEILALQLMANDWRSFVLLGDPACRLS